MLFKFKGFSIDCQKVGTDVLFLGLDVSKALGFANSSRSIRTLTRAHHQRKHSRSGVQGGRPAIYLTLSGVIKMALASELDSSVEFQDWICDEVVPGVLLEGAYLSPEITPAQAIAATNRLSAIADAATPWEKMWSREVVDRIQEYFGCQCDKTFWWKYIYNFLTIEERCKLDRLNPVSPKTKQRETRIHQWIEEEGEIKERLSKKVNEVQVLLRTSKSRNDFVDRYCRLMGLNQGEFDLEFGDRN
jgi:prophage antirepressor-like protein